MKTIVATWINFIIIIGTVMIFITSCKKEELIKDPIITWDNPTDIAYGTLLSEIQLNAKADVNGTFVYTPPIGTKLKEGSNQDLIVDFTPTNTTNYNTASKSVKINVTPPIIVTDIDGNVYHTVTIGTQVWMVENLQTTRYRDGSIIPRLIDGTRWDYVQTGAYFNYDYSGFNDNRYGRIYNWLAVNTGKLAPSGWHVPTFGDWDKLERYVQSNLGSSSCVASALASNTDWATSNVYGAIGNNLIKNNSSGFTGLPGGGLGGGEFGTTESNGGVSYSGFWWSSSMYQDGHNAWCRSLSFNSNNNLYYQYLAPQCFFSVRCVKN